MESEAAQIRAFLSYARADDREFSLVDPLVSKLKSLVKVKSGRDLEVFVDRESIGWGEDWRERLSESVQGATIFIPLLTATYLDRPACRDEFLAFHAKAEVLGVTELLLPILVFKSPLFTAENPDEIVQIAEALQYECIEEALLGGFESPMWLQCTAKLAEKLIAALAKAEASLLEADGSVATPVESGDSPPPDAVDEAGGLAEYMDVMSTSIDAMNHAATGLSEAMEGLGAATEPVGDLPDVPTPKQVQTWAIRLASGFKDPSAKLEAHGRDLYAATTRLDEAMIGIRQIAEELDSPELAQPLTEGLEEIVTNFGDLSESAESLDDLLVSMKPAEVISVPLRKSLQPARRGLTAVLDALRLIESWKLPAP